MSPTIPLVLSGGQRRSRGRPTILASPVVCALTCRSRTPEGRLAASTSFFTWRRCQLTFCYPSLSHPPRLDGRSRGGIFLAQTNPQSMTSGRYGPPGGVFREY